MNMHNHAKKQQKKEKARKSIRQRTFKPIQFRIENYAQVVPHANLSVSSRCSNSPSVSGDARLHIQSARHNITKRTRKGRKRHPQRRIHEIARSTRRQEQFFSGFHARDAFSHRLGLHLFGILDDLLRLFFPLFLSFSSSLNFFCLKFFFRRLFHPELFSPFHQKSEKKRRKKALEKSPKNSFWVSFFRIAIPPAPRECFYF